MVRSDGHRHDDRAGHVLLRVAGLAGQLHGLFEALQGEHDPQRKRRENAVDSVGHEATLAGVEVAPMERRRRDHDDREQRDGGLPDHDDRVALGHELRAGEVHAGKQGHADGRDDEPQPVQQPLFAAALVDHVEVLLYPG